MKGVVVSVPHATTQVETLYAKVKHQVTSRVPDTDISRTRHEHPLPQDPIFLRRNDKYAENLSTYRIKTLPAGSTSILQQTKTKPLPAEPVYIIV